MSGDEELAEFYEMGREHRRDGRPHALFVDIDRDLIEAYSRGYEDKDGQ